MSFAAIECSAVSFLILPRHDTHYILFNQVISAARILLRLILLDTSIPNRTAVLELRRFHFGRI